MKVKNGLALFFVVVLTGVLSPAYAGENKEKTNTSLTQCEEPRRMACPRDYQPVCGKKQDGSEQTYPNNCMACSDSDVNFHREGVCE